MSEQQIEGMPDGWRLVRIGTPYKGDCFIDAQGDVKHCSGGYHAFGYAIIEKIEQPKQYRQFANAAEFMSHPLANGWVDAGGEYFEKVTTCTNSGITFDDCELYTYKRAFEELKFLDGSPFGVEVTE